MSMAIKYNMAKKARKMAMGGELCAEHSSRGCPMCHGGMAEGGDVDSDMVGRIMKRRSGGAEANDTPPIADSEAADYDVLAEDDDLHADYTGANSGDEHGNAHEDAEDKDLVSRVMRSRAKKDRNPRPA